MPRMVQGNGTRALETKGITTRLVDQQLVGSVEAATAAAAEGGS